MGSDAGRPDERPVHVVEVRAFSLARTPVTRRQYEPFLHRGGAALPPWWRDPGFCDPEQPAVGVTWYDATAYAEWLTTVAGGAWRLPTFGFLLCRLGSALEARMFRERRAPQKRCD